MGAILPEHTLAGNRGGKCCRSGGGEGFSDPPTPRNGAGGVRIDPRLLRKLHDNAFAGSTRDAFRVCGGEAIDLPLDANFVGQRYRRRMAR